MKRILSLLCVGLLVLPVVGCEGDSSSGPPDDVTSDVTDMAPDVSEDPRPDPQVDPQPDPQVDPQVDPQPDVVPDVQLDVVPDVQPDTPSDVEDEEVTVEPCGNGTVDSGDGEVCDGSATPNGCDDTEVCLANCTACVPDTCGDGHYDSSVETCDESDTSDNGCDGSDVCYYDCSTCRPATCGNGSVDVGEEACDPSADHQGCANDDSEYCLTDCSGCYPYCGNGETEGSETCDDATMNGVTVGAERWRCDAQCDLTTICGDAVVDNPPETCEPWWIALTETGCSGATPVCELPGETNECTCIASGGCPAGVTPIELSNANNRVGTDDIWRFTATFAETGTGDYVPYWNCSVGSSGEWGGAAAVDVAFSFTNPGTAGTFVFTTDTEANLAGPPADAEDTIVYVLTDCDPDSDILACDDDVSFSNDNFLSGLYHPLDAGETVHVIVDAWDDTENGREFALEAARIDVLELDDSCTPTTDPLPRERCNWEEDQFCLADQCTAVTPPILDEVSFVSFVENDDTNCVDTDWDSFTWNFAGTSTYDLYAFEIDHPSITWMYYDSPGLFFLDSLPVTPDGSQRFSTAQRFCFLRSDGGDGFSIVPFTQPGGSNPVGFRVMNEYGVLSNRLDVEFPPPPTD